MKKVLIKNEPVDKDQLKKELESSYLKTEKGTYKCKTCQSFIKSISSYIDYSDYSEIDRSDVVPTKILYCPRCDGEPDLKIINEKREISWL